MTPGIATAIIVEFNGASMVPSATVNTTGRSADDEWASHVV
jgi:hypothetical protein